MLRDSPGDSSSNSSYLNHNSPGSNGGGDAGERMPNGGSSIQTLGYINGTMSPSSNVLTSHPRMSNGMQRQNSNSSTSNGANNRTGSTNQHNVNSPSRVVHIRGIPLEAHEEDIMALGAPFGRISNVLLLKGKNQVRDTIIPFNVVRYSILTFFTGLSGDGRRISGHCDGQQLQFGPALLDQEPTCLDSVFFAQGTQDG